MRMVRSGLVAGFLLASVQAASANVTFTLSDVTLSAMGTLASAGTLTGSFTTNDALSSVISFDITASPSGSFSGFEYTSGTATVTAATLPSQYVQLDSPNNVNELRLYFATPLTASGAALASASSYEHEPSGGNRLPSGSVVAASAPTAVPEPASLALLGVGLAAAAARRMRRTR